jgi:hypothetical protein
MGIGEFVRSGSLPRFGEVNRTDESRGEQEIDTNFGNLVRET